MTAAMCCLSRPVISLPSNFVAADSAAIALGSQECNCDVGHVLINRNNAVAG